MKNKLIYIFIILTVIGFNINFVNADALSEYKQQLLEVQQKKKETADALDGIEKEIANYIYDITVLDGEITIVSMRLQELEEKVEEITATLEEQETALQNSAQSYNALEDIYDKA